MTIEIRHIVFDIGRVLIHYDPHIPFSRLIPDDAERNWFFANVCTHDWNLEQDRGRSWEDAEALLITDYPDHAENIRAFLRNGNDWPEPLCRHSYGISLEEGRFEGMKEGRRVFYFKNSQWQASDISAFR